ncbi:MAG: tol-pal system protein YbgF, partial [Bradymonadaceae bacterium]
EPSRAAAGGSGREQGRARPKVAQKSQESGANVPNRRGGSPPAPSAGSDAGQPFAGRSGLTLYEMALAKFRSKEYAVALKGFERFVAEGPPDNYADNGLYWIGECHYGLEDYREAIEHFQRVLDEEPGGNKVPAAMLKMAMAYRRIGKPGKMKSVLQKLTKRYPDTHAGQLGEQKLAEFKS